MTSHRRRGFYGWTSDGDGSYDCSARYHWVSEDGENRYIEHYCPVCKITEGEKTDCEWRPFGDKLELGISNDR